MEIKLPMKFLNFKNIIKKKSIPIFLVSYPKSGNTWVRFLIANYLTNNGSINFQNLSDFCPEYETESSGSKRRNQEPIIFKSHSAFSSKFKKVIYIVRDGRDVAVSYYFYHLKFILKNKQISFSEFLKRFNNGNVNYGSWNNHVNNWISNKPRQFLLIKYEDLFLKTEGELIKILKFINLPIDKKKVTSAIHASKFEEMAKIENKQIKDIPKLSDSDIQISFMRKGEIGDYVNYFNDDMEAEFWQVQGETMKQMGYYKN